MLSVTLNNVDTELQENREKIKILTENNKALTLKVDTLSKNIDNKNKEIKELKSENKHLQEMVDYFKNLFSRLVKFIKNKMFGKDKEREEYWRIQKICTNTAYLVMILLNQLKMIIFGIKKMINIKIKVEMTLDYSFFSLFCEL